MRCWAPTSSTYASSAKERKECLRGLFRGQALIVFLPLPIYCKLAHRLQHREAPLAIGPLFRLNETRAEKRFQPCQDVGRAIQIGNFLARFERPATDEDRQASKECLLLGR